MSRAGGLYFFVMDKLFISTRLGGGRKIQFVLYVYNEQSLKYIIYFMQSLPEMIYFKNTTDPSPGRLDLNTSLFRPSCI